MFNSLRANNSARGGSATLVPAGGTAWEAIHRQDSQEVARKSECVGWFNYTGFLQVI